MKNLLNNPFLQKKKNIVLRDMSHKQSKKQRENIDNIYSRNEKESS